MFIACEYCTQFFPIKDQDICLASEKDVAKFIMTKISEGHSLNELKLLIKEHVKHVKHVLFKDRNQPPHYNTRFWPSNKSIRNSMHSALNHAKEFSSAN